MKTYLEFKTKAVDIFNIDNSFSHKEVFLPNKFKTSHIYNRENNRMLSGKINPDIFDIRVKSILKSIGIGECFSLNNIPCNIKVKGTFILTITVELN